MKQRDLAITLFAAGGLGSIALTYLLRARRAKTRVPPSSAMTIAVPRDRVEAFVESRERMLDVLESKRDFGRILRLSVSDAPDGRGAEVRLAMRGTNKYAVKEILRRVKALLETGEVPTARMSA